VTDTLTAAIGAGATFVGAGLGFAGLWVVSRRERREAQKERLRLALGAYLGALYEVVGLLRGMPDVRASPVAMLVDRVRGEAATWVAMRRSAVRLGGLPEHQRAVAALAQLQVLPMPLALMEAIATSADYMIELGGSRAPAVVDRWPEVYRSLHEAKELIETWHGR
jgi:hypothetical protein